MEQPSIELSKIGDTRTSRRSNDDAVVDAIQHEDVSTGSVADSTALSRGDITGLPTAPHAQKRPRFSFAHDLEVHTPHEGTSAVDSGLPRDFYGQ